MHHESVPFTIPDIRDLVPGKLKPCLLVAFVVVFQLSGGVYLASVCEMTGSLSLLQEDIMMAGYASLVGLSLTFTIMFRLKFRFSMKTSLLVPALGLVVCNLICMHTSNVPLLVAVCFVAGFLRMWGTFTCNTHIQLWVTPTRDLSVWFVYIYMLVQGFIQLSGLATIYTAYLSTWEYMHWVVVGLLLCLVLATLLLVRRNPSMRRLPLFGIDWTGIILWAATVLSAIFVLNYGEYYDWFDSAYIWIGTLFFATALGLNLWRASFIRHPYIELKTWTFRHVWLTFLLYIVVDILLSPTHFFEHVYTERILGYDALNNISLNWIVLLGIACGGIFSYYTFALRKWKYKTMTLIGFSLIVGYLLVMYFTIDYNLPKEMLYLPIFMRGAGYVIIAITFITSLSGIPFQNFAQSLTIQSFVSACCGSLIGSAILTTVFRYTMSENLAQIGAHFDRVNPVVNHMSLDSLFGMVQQHATIVSMKEMYGLLCILGIFCILVFLLRESSLRPTALHPKFSTIRREIKQQLRLGKVVDENA